MKQIKLSKRESEKLTKRMRKHLGKKSIPKEIKNIFLGAPVIMCHCRKPRKKIYEIKDLEKFILKLQDILFYRREK